MASIKQSGPVLTLPPRAAPARKSSAAAILRHSFVKFATHRRSKSPCPTNLKKSASYSSLHEKNSAETLKQCGGSSVKKKSSVPLQFSKSKQNNGKNQQGLNESENLSREFAAVSDYSIFEDTEEFLVGQNLADSFQPATSTPTVHLAVHNSTDGYGKSASEKNFGALTDSEVLSMSSGNSSSLIRKPSALSDRNGASSKHGSKLSLNSSSKLGGQISGHSSKENVSREEGTLEGSHSRSSSPKGSKSDKGERTGNLSKLSNNSAGQHGANVGRIASAATSLKNLLAPNYKSRNEEFRKLFKNVQESEKFVIDYACAFQKEILHQGRMYLSQRSVCFYANIFGKWETNIVIKLKEIASITKEKTAKVIPNAMQIVTKSGEKYFFASFATRDKSYMMLFKMWQSALLDQVISPQDLWVWAQHGYDIEDLPVSDMDEQDSDPNMMQASHSNGENGILNSSLEAGSSLNSETPPFFILGPDSETGALSRSYPHMVQSTPKLEAVAKKRRKVGPGVKKSGHSHLMPPSDLVSSPAAEDFSESSENDVEHTCPCSIHEGQELVNAVYPLSVDQMFILLFTDSVFFRNFHEMRKTTDLELGEWVVDSDGMKTRNVAYSINLNHSMAPKSAGVKEKQTCNQHGQVYVLRVEAQNLGIPYADSFYVSSVYCLSRVSANQSRLRCHANVVFRKNLWGIVKSFIEKNSFVGMQEHFTELDKFIREECTRLGLPAEMETPQPRLRSPGHKRDLSATRTGDRGRALRHEDRRDGTLAQGRQYGFAGVGSYLPPEIEWTAKAILSIMVVMLLLNGLLFYKLWCLEWDAEIRQKYSMEYKAQDLKYLLEKSELSTEDLLRIYKSYQDRAADRWLTALHGTIGTLSHIEQQLHELRRQLNEAEAEFSFFGKESQRLKEKKSVEKGEL